MTEKPHGVLDRREMPNGHFLQYYTCEGPECGCVHVVVLDVKETPICTFTIDEPMILGLYAKVEAIRDKKKL